MQILSIHLKNIKSHRDSEIHFSPGINVLSGPNGIGKSTIFEAIGYAMFGVDARDFVSNVDRFLTIGAKRGEIAVVFTADDGETYRVSRTVGTPANWRLAKETGGGFEIEDHANIEETEARIKELLGLAAGRSLAEQFKLVIGPFQNEFLGPFVLKQQSKRKEAFDEILGIDSWRKTFDGTKELGTIIKAKIGTLEAEIAGKEERVAVLPERQKELAGLNEEQASKIAELESTTAALALVNGHLQKMEEQKNGLEALRSELAQVLQSITSGNEHITNQKALVEQAISAARAAEEARPGKERFETAEKQLAELREREKAKLALEKEIAELGNRQASALQAADHEEKEAVAQEKALKEGIAVLDKQEEVLKQASSALLEKEKMQQEAIDRQREVEAGFRELSLHQVPSISPYLKVTLEKLNEIDNLVHQKNALLLAEKDWKEKAATLDHLRKEREAAQAEKAKLEGTRVGIIEGEQKLAEGLCPFFQEQCGNLGGKASLEVFGTKKRQLDALIEGHARTIATMDKKIAEAEAAGKEMEKFRLLRNEIANLEKERLERDKERIEHVKLLDVTSVIATFEHWMDSHGVEQCRKEGERLIAAEFTGPPNEQLAALKHWEQGCHDLVEMVGLILGKMQTALDEPMTAIKAEKARMDAASEEMERRRLEFSETEKRITGRRQAAATHRETATAADKEKQGQLAAFAQYAHVEASITENENVKKLTQPDHERFLQAEPLALDLPKRQETLAKYVKRLEDLEKDKTAKQAKLGELEGAYSAEAHAETMKNKEALQTGEAALRESLNNLSQNLKRITAEIAELERIQGEIKSKQSEVQALKKKEELVKFLRNKVFKNVSAQLSERFREEISLRADSIYRTIAEADEELYWGDNYQIVLRDMSDGAIRERSDDQLSGGQVMSAVVALRLALLQTIGARVAFFDEPTSNLDASRRSNLAQAFRAIDHGKEEVTEHWYDQLFLISHDVSFTEITDQVIDLSEDKGN
ncbi:DNA repair exonuclease SbcCD, C subunit, putative [Geotalea daltonii FRC-32]|uniref:DNA repair exonuclease SbcCD, C subunit, putative n=1 Tax=Geotalea daltonii (strain DSM 22248 / JCM 15807 / FRC-32) TaxID=316067 RepID=B9M469_GEODF|nr:SMC family ATPase [Geotalea daltonii]ACM21524.1 DNA repair exonuclease SbcCD, C subunit, putative [Geotalea daltonii FRC-32]